MIFTTVYLQNARRYFEHLMCINSLIQGRSSYLPLFTDEETKAQSFLSNLLKATQLASGGAWKGGFRVHAGDTARLPLWGIMPWFSSRLDYRSKGS